MSSRFNRVALAVGVLCGCTGVAQAWEDGETLAEARVVEAQPIYETVQIPEGREVCHSEPVTYYEPGPRYRRSESGEVLGLIVGGLIGNQFGRGSGRAAATVGGAMLGSAIARDADRNRYYRGGREVTRHEEFCEWRDEYRTERRLTGYDVTYDYNGAIGHIVTERHPGQTVRVRVAVEAVDY